MGEEFIQESKFEKTLREKRVDKNLKRKKKKNQNR